ncbi:MAG: hypothetical protein WCT45_01455 [Candidatus Paceibacterota bacterium]|jgi:hypothetical protein
MSLLLLHHLGLGDHFMVHGIVREYCKKYDRVAIFALPHNYVSVSFMFRDLPNLTVLQGDEAFAREYIQRNASAPSTERYDEVKVLGFESLRRSGTPLEQQFYDLAGIALAKKWESFFVERDRAREEELFERIAPQGPYAFLHEDRTRDFTINRGKIRSDLALFVPDPAQTDNVFDYCTLIERAQEVHVIDSSFMFLIDCLPYTAPDQKLFVHRYARPNPSWKLPILKKPWHIILLKNYTSGLVAYIRQWLHEYKMRLGF